MIFLEPPHPRPYVSCLVFGVFCVNKLLYCFVLYCTIVYCDKTSSDEFLSETKKLRLVSDNIPKIGIQRT